MCVVGVGVIVDVGGVGAVVLVDVVIVVGAGVGAFIVGAVLW